MTGRDTGATNREFGDYLVRTLEDPSLKSQ